MSEQTLADLENAIAAHVVSEQGDGNVLLDWVVVASSKEEEDFGKRRARYDVYAQLTAPHHHMVGLLDTGMMLLQDGDEDDDD